MEARRAETSEPVVRKSIARLDKHLARETAAIEAAIGEHLAANAALHADCERLCAIPGVGLKTARWLVAELPRHLPNSRTAAAWCGLTPRLCQSGSSVRGASSIGREGNRFLRKFLYMPALVARRANPAPQSIRRFPGSPRQIQNVRAARRRAQASPLRLHPAQTPVLL